LLIILSDLFFMYQRPHLQQIIDRLSEPRRFIQVVAGPRQVGKTTLFSQLAALKRWPYHYISADTALGDGVAWLRQQWEVARLAIAGEGVKEFVLIIDEVQKLEHWSEVVKALWDEDSFHNRNIKVVLLGSSRLLLKRGLKESMAGRFEMIYMGHWSFNEMHAAFGWSPEQYVWFGGYPASAELIENETRWKSYVRDSLIETSISKDILMLTRVDKPALMKQLFELGSLYSGQILSFTKIIGQLQDAGNATTLSNYLELLNTAGLLTGLQKYSDNMIRKRSSIPKFQVYNTALISALRRETFEEVRSNHVEWGRMVESAIGAHLLNYSVIDNYHLEYWREGNDEVDFVIRDQQVVGIEVRTATSKATKGMDSFIKKFQPGKILLVGDSGLGWKDFLKMNPGKLMDK